ncbi:MAG TPA: tetratricopeptide repeat protein [Bryobacteraceae bacterium]|jgi:tetratricopeptide (TPR) repeat protein|nr:tetratricopeptide repeat protein [Bryobacteraceae bacterium]
MKYLIVCAQILALLSLSACNQSPQRLLEAANKYHANKKYKEASILYRKAITRDKKFGEAYYREGLNLLDQNQPVEAAKFLRRAVDLQPSNSDAETRLAEIYLAAYSSYPKKLKNLLPDIKELTTKILKKDPHSFNGIRLQGMLDLATNNKEKALAEFQEANSIHPYSREVVGWYAETLSSLGHAQEAEKLLQDMMARDKTWGPSYDLLYLMDLHNDDPTKAEAVLRERVANNPTSPTAVSNLANFLSQHNRPDEAEAVMKKVLDDRSHFPAGREMLGDFYYRNRKFDKALDQYQAGVKEDSKNALHYQQRIVGAYSALGRSADALQLAKHLVEQNPKDSMTNELYASLLLETGRGPDVHKSLADLQKLVQNNGKDAILHLDLARAYFALGDFDKSSAEAQEAVHIRPTLMPAHLVIGRILEDRKQHAKALEQTDIILNAEPQNADARLVRDRALIGINELDQAQPELEQLVQKYPKMTDARVELADLYLGRKDFVKAKEQLDAAWAAKDVRGFLGLQQLALMQGKADQAVKAVQGLVDQNPKVLPYRYSLANFEIAAAGMDHTDPTQAKALWGQAADNLKTILKTTTNSADLWVRLGIVQRQLGQYDAALASFEQASNADSKNETAYLNRGMLLEFLGRQKEASDMYNRVLGVDPQNTLALNNLAFLGAETGDNLDRAMTLAEQAKKRAPNSPDVSDTLGYVYYKKNLNSEAIRIFRQLVEEKPQNSTFRYHLALALLKQGDKQEAKAEAEKALQMSSVPQEQNKIRTLVSQIG